MHVYFKFLGNGLGSIPGVFIGLLLFFFCFFFCIKRIYIYKYVDLHFFFILWQFNARAFTDHFTIADGRFFYTVKQFSYSFQHIMFSLINDQLWDIYRSTCEKLSEFE